VLEQLFTFVCAAEEPLLVKLKTIVFAAASAAVLEQLKTFVCAAAEPVLLRLK
jgi:hypothetical protein